MTPPRPVMRMVVKVDHNLDGGGEKGKYTIGWPRVRRSFKRGQVILTDYDYLTFNVKFDSDRNAVAAESAPFCVNFQSHEGAGLRGTGDIFLDFGSQNRVWFPVRISIRDLIKRTKLDPKMWRNLSGIQMVISEDKYDHGTRLQLDFDRIELVKVTKPAIEFVQCADTIILPAKFFPVKATSIGMPMQTSDSTYQWVTILSDKNGKLIDRRTVALSPEMSVMLNLKNLSVGQYMLEVRVVNRANGAIASKRRKNIEVIRGYLK